MATASSRSPQTDDVELAGIVNTQQVIPPSTTPPITPMTDITSRNVSRGYSLRTKFVVVLLLSLAVALTVMHTSKLETSTETAIVTNVTTVVREGLNDEREWNYLEERIRKQDNIVPLTVHDKEGGAVRQNISSDSPTTVRQDVDFDAPNRFGSLGNTNSRGDNVSQIVATTNETGRNGIHQSSSFPTAMTPWTPLGNECHEEFRIANTTKLHCGYGKVSPLSEDGHLCGGVPMIPGFCALPKRGQWKAPIAGEKIDMNVLLPRRFGRSSYQSRLQPCKSVSSFLDGRYEGESFDQEWVPSSCSSIPLDPYTWSENKCQTTITMLGDSHIRNLFTATINGFRGVRYFAEAHAGDAIKESGIVYAYEWRLYQNESAVDRLDVHLNVNQKHPDAFEPCPCGVDDVVRCLRVGFIWAPSFREQAFQMHYVTEWDSDLVIVEPGNAYERNTAVWPKWLVILDELMKENKHLHLGIVAWPWNIENVVKERTSILTNWTGPEASHSTRKSFWLHKSGLYDGESTKQGQTLWHFACSLGKEKVPNDRIQAVEPCTDQTDTSQIRGFATVHFDAFKQRSRPEDGVHENLEIRIGHSNSGGRETNTMQPTNHSRSLLGWRH
mmetsp:Transcript_19215/g.40226  ORF Transcript_19215/g.40226 Transcript_19215/m.40226 type:complete len:612 (+) Transcript_19215:75-1910(+)